MPQHVIDLLITKSRTETLQRPQYLRHDNFHFRCSDRSTITSFADDDNHLLLYPFVDEGAPVPANDENPTNGPADPIHDAVRLDTDDDDASSGDEDDNARSVAGHDDDSVAYNTDDDDSNTDDDGSSGDDDDEDDTNNLSHDDTDDNDNSEDDDDDEDGTNNLPETAEERGELECGELLITNDDNDEPNLLETEERGELLIDDAPLNSLEAVINRTNPITVLNRDPSVKNTINPEVTTSNILPSAPGHRPSTRTYSMRQPIVPSYAKGGFNLAIACTQMTAKEGD
jgi:hypothetical protein